MLIAKDCKHPLGICNTCCISTAKVVARRVPALRYAHISSLATLVCKEINEKVKIIKAVNVRNKYPCNICHDEIPESFILCIGSKILQNNLYNAPP